MMFSSKSSSASGFSNEWPTLFRLPSSVFAWASAYSASPVKGDNTSRAGCKKRWPRFTKSASMAGLQFQQGGSREPKHTVPWIYTLGIYDSSVRQSDATIASYTKSSGQLMTGYSFLGLTTPSCQTVPFWLEAGSICLQFPCTSDYPVLGLHAQFFQWRGSIGSRAPINKLRAGS